MSIMLAPMQVQAKFSCRALLEETRRGISYPKREVRELLAYWKTASKYEKFDFELYEQARINFRENPLSLPMSNILEEKIAHLDIGLERLGAEECDVDAILKSGTWTKKRELLRLVDGHRFHRAAGKMADGRAFTEGLTEFETSQFFADLYSLNGISTVPGLGDWLSADVKSELNSKLRNHITLELRSHGLRKFLGKARLLPPTKMEFLRKVWVSDQMSWVLSALTNFKILNGILGTAPKITWYRITPEQMERLWSGSRKDVVREIATELSGGYKNQAIYNGFADAYQAAAAISVGVLIYEEIREAFGEYQDEKKKHDRQNQILDAEIREAAIEKKALQKHAKLSPNERLFEDWKEEYSRTHGGAAPETAPEYAAMKSIYLEN